MKTLALLLLVALPALGQISPVLTGVNRFQDELEPADFYMWDDFTGASASAGLIGTIPWSTSTAGGGTISIAQAWFLSRPGTLELRSAGTLADRILVHAAANIGLSNGPAMFECSVYVPVLPTTGANYQSRYGLHDNVGNPAAEGAYFEITNTSVHAQWKCVTANSSTRTTSTAISNVVVGWNYMKWVANANGTEVVFYIGTHRANAFPVATNTSNIPIDWVNARVANISMSLLASNNITVTNHVDYVGYRHRFNIAR